MEMSLGALSKEDDLLSDEEQILDENSSVSKLEIKEDVLTPIEEHSINDATLNSDLQSLEEDPKDENLDAVKMSENEPIIQEDSLDDVNDKKDAKDSSGVNDKEDRNKDLDVNDMEDTKTPPQDKDVPDDPNSLKPEDHVPSDVVEQETNENSEQIKVGEELDDKNVDKSSSETGKERGSSVSFPSIFSTSLQSIRSTLSRRSLSKEPAVNQTDDLVNGSKELEKPNGKKSMKVERRSLLGMAKLSVKGLIESSLSAGHTLDSDHTPLQQFFVIIEYVLRQGLKAPKNFFMPNKYFWPPLEAIERFNSEASEITSSVRSLPGIRTHLGKGRAWLRLAIMQKKLADYFKILIDNKEMLSEWYDEGALLMNEEATVMAGHLVGLNCIDANLCMKGDDLDNQEMVIDYSLYMKDGNHGIFMEEENGDEDESAMQKLVNQKNYLEERNRHLEDSSNDLQKRTDQLEAENKTMMQEVEALKIQMSELKNEREKMVNEKKDMTFTHQKTLEIREKDLDTERETLRKSKAGLDEMYTQIQKQLKHETQMRMEVEKELELQMSMKHELEVAMKLLEKDIYDKQDGLVTLREQLDNVKAINLEIYKKLQSKSIVEEDKNKTILSLENETRSLAKKVSKLQQQLEEEERNTLVAREQAGRYNQQLDDMENKRIALTTNIQVEREWRQSLEAKLEKMEQDKVLLEEQLSVMSQLREELRLVTIDRDDLRQSCMEQEHTINDLAGHLGESKQVLGDLKEVHKTMTSSQWESDKQASTCAQCEKPFNLARRKHHCRNCGQIYCNSCSDNTMPLASSAKPVRVCDTCHTTLLQRFSAGSLTS